MNRSALVFARFAISVIFAWLPQAHARPPSSVEDACELLKNQLAKIEGLPGGKPYKGWFCDPWDDYSNSRFYVIALRSYPDPAAGMDHIQSAGEWAISKRTGALRYFDLSKERITAVPKVYYSRPASGSTTGQRGTKPPPRSE